MPLNKEIFEYRQRIKKQKQFIVTMLFTLSVMLGVAFMTKRDASNSENRAIINFNHVMQLKADSIIMSSQLQKLAKWHVLLDSNDKKAIKKFIKTDKKNRLKTN